MTLYQISYDLHEPGKDYKELFEAIKTLGDYTHILESGWIVDSADKSASDIRDELKTHIDRNDRLLVAKFGSNWATTFSDDSTDWLHDH